MREEIIQLKQYLGHISRKETYRVIMFLYKNSSKSIPFAVNEVVNKLNIKQSEVSHGLAAARKMGLVNFSKNGNQRFYWAEHKTIERFERQVNNTIERWK